jgi:hypothetical protein
MESQGNNLSIIVKVMEYEGQEDNIGQLIKSASSDVLQKLILPQNLILFGECIVDLYVMVEEQSNIVRQVIII